MPWWIPLANLGAAALSRRKGKQDARDARDAEYQYQKEFAQHGIRWRVEDAKAAGLHPLYALGANVSSYSPSFGGGETYSSGQNITRSVGATSTRQEREIRELELETARKSLQETDARIGLLDSQAAVYRQQVSGVPALPRQLSEQFSNVVGAEGQTMMTAAPVISHGYGDESVTAGVNAGWSRFSLGKGIEVVLPSVEGGGMSEAVEALSESAALLAFTVAENRARYGPQVADLLMDRLFGGSPQDQARREELNWFMRLLDSVPGIRVSRGE